MAINMSILPDQRLVLNAWAVLAGMKPGNIAYNDHVTYVTNNGGAAFIDALNGAFAGYTDAQLGAAMLTNLHLTSIFTQADAEAYLAMNAADRVGAMIALADALYGFVGTDAAILAAQSAYQNDIDNAYGYSRLTANPNATWINAGQVFDLDAGTVGTADVMRLTGDMDARIDLTANDNQVKGLDLDGDGTIETNGVENSNPTALDDGMDFEIVDAYARTPGNTLDRTTNFLGDIYFDGTGFGGDGVNTDGNIFLGGLGVDTALGGIGNDFLAGGGIAQGRTGTDTLSGGRNADFFFAELSRLDATDGNAVSIDGGVTADDNAAGSTQSAQDADWLLLEASDDDEPVTVTLRDDTTTDPGETSQTQNGSVVTRAGAQVGTLRDIENFDASGNLYGFLNGLNVALGAGGRMVNGENIGLGSSAQLNIVGSHVANIIVGGYDNDTISGNDGNDLLMGGNLRYAQNNPNSADAAIPNDGKDVIYGNGGNDNIVWEADGGIYEGMTDLATDGGDDDTLWLTSQSFGTGTASMATDSTVRLDLFTGHNGGLANAAGYGGADVNYSGMGVANFTADQTNWASSATRTLVADMESVIATGMGAIDYDTDGTNAGDMAHTSQMNFQAFSGNLDLRGTSGVNTLYAAGGDDVLEGRLGGTLSYNNAGVVTADGRDKLSGGDGRDDFVFYLQASAGDGVDVIHRQHDAGNNITDGTFERDFGIGSTSQQNASHLTVDFTGSDLALPGVAVTTFDVTVDGVLFSGGTAAVLGAFTTVAALATHLNTVFHAQDADVSVTSSGNVVTVTKTDGGTFGTDIAGGTIIAGTATNGPLQTLVGTSTGALSTTPDRLIYQAYEDRFDGEKVDDDATTGSSISLGRDAYAEDLVIDFTGGTTRIAEDQSYTLTFTNLTTEDRVEITVNSVKYTLTVGIDLDGNDIANEELVAQGGTAADQAAIQTNFLARMAIFINTFMDNDTAVGQVAAVAAPTTLVLTQVDYNGEDTVFMRVPTVSLTNGSGGEVATATVVNNSQHELELLGFDGRNNQLNDANVLFLGNSGTSRSILETTLTAGETLNGTEAVVVDGGANDLANVANNTATNSKLRFNFTVHGDDFLIGGAGNDTINGLSGDDRVHGSLGTDTLDGGKSWYAVQVLGEAEARVVYLNQWEASNPTQVTALQGLAISSINRIADSEVDGTGFVAGVGTNEVYNDTLQFQQNDFTANTTRFTVTLNNFQTVGGVVQLRNGGAGTVGVDNDGNGVIDSTTTFTNFENVRTVSGTGNAVAGDGQGNDTLDVSALSTATGGISYDLTNRAVAAPTSTAGDVRYSTNADTAADGGGDAAGALFADENDFETLVMKVDGVESVIGGNGNDLVMIDETEAAKNNSFSAGLGNDRIEYLNTFGAPEAVAQPTVTIRVNSATDTDTVTMTAGRVGTTVATDTLVSVERIALNGNTAEGSRENDVVDVTAMATGAVVDFTNGQVRDLAGNVQVIIENIAEMENVWADGNDTVIVADNMGALNAREDTADGTASRDLALATFVDFDTLTNPNTTNTRVAFANQTTGQIENAINQNQYRFEMSRVGTDADSDTVDYSGTLTAVNNDNISVRVELDPNQANQYVLVDTDGAAFFDATGDLEEAGDRIDVLTSVERIVASTGESVLDLTASTKGLEVQYQALDVANRVAALDRDVYTVQISDLSSSVPLTRNYVEYRDAGTIAPATQVDQVAASWNRIEGSDYAERVVMNSAHSANNNTMNLRGGANEVKYNELTRSITATLDAVDFVATDVDGADNIFGTADDTGLITTTVQFQDGTGAGVEGPMLNATTDVIRSYTVNNGVASGSLRIAASQDAEDTLKFAAGAAEKLFLVSEVGTTDNQITVKIGAGAAQNSIVLTGFELLSDAASNDIYDFGALVTAAAGLNFTDNVAADHDTIKVGNDAKDVDGTNALGGGAQNAGPTEISLGALRDYGTLSPAGFDFDVLDVTKVTDTLITTLTGASVTGEVNTDEVVIGAINNINSALLFESVVFTQATVAENGTTFVLNTGTNSVTAGARTIALTDGTNTLSFGGTVLEQAAGGALRAATSLNATSGVTVTITGTEAVNLTGGNGNDSLTGGNGGDTLRGNSGNDTLNGNFVAQVNEVHTYTLTDGAGLTGGAGRSVIIDGVTITEGVNIQGIVVAEDDVDAIGAAFVREWNAVGGAAFTQEANLASVTYDVASNALTFSFTSAAGNVADGVLVEGAGTGQAVVGAETVTTAFAARAESADTYVFETTAALNGADTLNNVDATDTFNFSAFLGAGNGGGTVQNGGDFALMGAGAGTIAAVTDLVTSFNKASLSAADFAAAATAGKFFMTDGDIAVFAVSADADGVAADGTINAWSLYYVSNGATAGTGDLTVTLVGTVNSSAAELAQADIAAML